MKYEYEKFGLVNTRDMFADALRGGYAVPAFNFFNLENLQAIASAAADTRSPVILAVSESALKYMGAAVCVAMVESVIRGRGIRAALHLDHGHSLAACRDAIDSGFSSVMIDGSALSFDENVELSRSVVDYAGNFGVSVEAELGALAGIEDENTRNEVGFYTNPDDVVKFVGATGCDSLAVAVGTSHGAYKRRNDAEELRFDILDEIARRLPDFPLVLHGASNIPENLVAEINRFGGRLGDARGIPADQIRRATAMNVCKVNVDSDSRLAWFAAARELFANAPENYDPRVPLAAARQKMRDLYVWEIENIMGSGVDK
ncbi:MAG: ketose-bisphosphate aldolase [Rickettsiales bacterium]|jgi:fructose-bisphosphate aldolase class II|nr:ketose-bisphosphate aldolase [Rickettsiales bacterium]